MYRSRRDRGAAFTNTALAPHPQRPVARPVDALSGTKICAPAHGPRLCDKSFVTRALWQELCGKSFVARALWQKPAKPLPRRLSPRRSSAETPPAKLAVMACKTGKCPAKQAGFTGQTACPGEFSGYKLVVGIGPVLWFSRNGAGRRDGDQRTSGCKEQP
jgi:hypothetical protein